MDVITDGLKHDGGKFRLSLVPTVSYKKVAPERYRDALMRHFCVNWIYKGAVTMADNRYEREKAKKKERYREFKSKGICTRCRKEAADFFLEGMASTEGSECERYATIYTKLILGYKVCSDED